jgi:hypothetical protein
MNKRQLMLLRTIEGVLYPTWVREEIAAGKHYKEIYASIKAKLLSFSAQFGLMLGTEHNTRKEIEDDR